VPQTYTLPETGESRAIDPRTPPATWFTLLHSQVGRIAAAEGAAAELSESRAAAELS